MRVSFDMQSFLQIPYRNASSMYYSKLCCYNLISNIPNNVLCYTWHKVNGKRGSLEIGTCLYNFLCTLPGNIKEVSRFFDTCGAHSRKQNITAFLKYLVKKTKLLSKNLWNLDIQWWNAKYISLLEEHFQSSSLC